MKALKYGISFALVAGFALTASCGGSSNSGDDSAAAGTSSGGDDATAGTSNPSAGTNAGAGAHSVAGATSGGGETSAGGLTGEGGAPEEGGTTNGGGGKANSGGGAAGAAAMNPAGCPATLPKNNAMCTPLAKAADRCAYTGESCDCRVPRGGNGPGMGEAGAASEDGLWQCVAVPIPPVCPATKPTVGEACTTQNGACQYPNMGACLCGQSKKWQCFGGGNGGGAGAGAGGASSAGGAGGADGGTTCPTVEPKTGAACTGDGACPYANGGCLCINKKFFCG